MRHSILILLFILLPKLLVAQCEQQIFTQKEYYARVFYDGYMYILTDDNGTNSPQIEKIFTRTDDLPNNSAELVTSIPFNLGFSQYKSMTLVGESIYLVDNTNYTLYKVDLTESVPNPIIILENLQRESWLFSHENFIYLRQYISEQGNNSIIYALDLDNIANGLIEAYLPSGEFNFITDITIQNDILFYALSETNGIRIINLNSSIPYNSELLEANDTYFSFGFVGFPFL